MQVLEPIIPKSVFWMNWFSEWCNDLVISIFDQIGLAQDAITRSNRQWLDLFLNESVSLNESIE